MGACWADLNGDGFLDLYVGTYETSPSSGDQADAVLTNSQGTSFLHSWTEPQTDGTWFPSRPVLE